MLWVAQTLDKVDEKDRKRGTVEKGDTSGLGSPSAGQCEKEMAAPEPNYTILHGSALRDGNQLDYLITLHTLT